ncbi:hypothetical protein J8I29_11695 [Labrys sp. LIt4]|uniref:hypothetical protein n=1 Tax=Labrys sp. LIt4 TaxID=2821355 RepID=UPI001ADFFED7|nr:hypothetical protein [Labrys sp. LIt4]MBP0579973.1 hypothetical protein [Labrys sp. LIt4]
MNNVIPLGDRVAAATPAVRGAVIPVVRGRRQKVAPGAIRAALRPSCLLYPDTGRLECRWDLSGCQGRADASQLLCSKCAGTAADWR